MIIRIVVRLFSVLNVHDYMFFRLWTIMNLYRNWCFRIFVCKYWCRCYETDWTCEHNESPCRLDRGWRHNRYPWAGVTWWAACKIQHRSRWWKTICYLYFCWCAASSFQSEYWGKAWLAHRLWVSCHVWQFLRTWRSSAHSCIALLPYYRSRRYRQRTRSTSLSHILQEQVCF